MTLNPASKTTDSSDSRGGNLQETDRKTANSGNSNDAVVKSEKVSQAFAKSGVERNFRQAQPVLWWCALVGPAVVGLLILTSVFLIQGPDALDAYETRIELGRLHHLMNHWLLFGPSYGHAARQVASRLVSMISRGGGVG